MPAPGELLRRAVAVTALLGWIGAPRAAAFSLLEGRWPDGPVPLQLQLQTSGPSAQGLTDGSSSWNQVAARALSAWNVHMTDTRFDAVSDSTAAKTAGNGLNNVYWATGVYGETFDEYTLGVTLIETSDDAPDVIETDVVFNSGSAPGWDSYRGALKPFGKMDFERVAMHEFGHVLGLDHPDQNSQTVTALMNSTAGDVDRLVADDIRGITYLYGPKAAPTFLSQPVEMIADEHQSVSFTAEVTGRGPITYVWEQNGLSNNFGARGFVRPERTSVSYHVSFADAGTAGDYRVVVSNPYGVASSATVKLRLRSGITQLPTDQAVVEGGSATFTVAATGAGTVQYRWQHETSLYQYVDLPGETGPSLTINNVKASDLGRYRVIVQVDGKTYEPQAQLRYKLGIAEQPATQGVDPGQSATFSATVAGVPRLAVPLDVMVDPTGEFYVADSSVRRVSAEGTIATLGSNQGGQIFARDRSGTFFTASVAGHAVYKLPPGGPLFLLAGEPNSAGGNREGWLDTAGFGEVYGLVVDAQDNLYVADRAGGVIQKITPRGHVSILAGDATNRSSWGPPPIPLDGVGRSARFGNLRGLAIDSAGNLYASDCGEEYGLIRRITPTGNVSTLAGSSARLREIADGTGDGAAFWKPGGVAVDEAGNVYVADAGTIRRITSAGVVTTLAGAANSYGYQDGPAANARFSEQVLGLDVAADGTIYIADSLNHTIRTLSPAGTVATAFGDPGQSGPTDGGPLTYQWFRDDQPVAGATRPTLTISNVQVADVGEYVLRVSSPDGTVYSAPALLGLRPSIVTQPVRTMAMPGESVTLRVNATSPTGRPLTYQWRRLDAPIPGATQSTLTLPNIGVSDTADYSVVVSDGQFTTESERARVAIALQLTQPLASTFSVADGADLHLSAGVQSAEEPAFRTPRGFAFDGAGNLYIVDAGNCTIRKLSPSGEVTTIAGEPGSLVRSTEPVPRRDSGHPTTSPLDPTEVCT